MIPAIIWLQKSIRGIIAFSPVNRVGGLDDLQFRRGADYVQRDYLAIMETISPISIRFWPDG